MKNKGISLIVLVITIIVMIILAAAIIISLNNTGIIGNANKAVDETNEKTLVELANLAWGEASANSRTTGKLASANYFQKSVEDALAQNNVDLSQYEVIAGEDGVQVFKKNDWEYAYTATNDAWNDTKLEKAKGDTIPEDAKIVVRFYKTNKKVGLDWCPDVMGLSLSCEEKQKELVGNEYYMVMDGIGKIPDLCESFIRPAAGNPIYGYMNDNTPALFSGSITARGWQNIRRIFVEVEAVPYVTHAKISDRITSIGKATFYRFDNLTNVILPESLTQLGTDNREVVFEGTKLNNLIIPKNVTNMPTDFYSGINNLYVETTSLTEIGDYKDFEGTIYVRNDAMKALFESKIDSSKAKVSTNYNW